MPTHRGDLIASVKLVLDDIDYILFVYGPNFSKDLKAKLQQAEAGTMQISNKLMKIKKLAVKTKNKDLLDIINEEIVIWITTHKEHNLLPFLFL